LDDTIYIVKKISFCSARGITVPRDFAAEPKIGVGAAVKCFCFPKTKRLVRNEQFRTVLARNLRRSNGLLTLFIAKNDCAFARLGVSVAKACGGAVLRNRLKRLAREAFRQCQDKIPARFDYMVVISPKSLQKTDNLQDYREALKKITLEQIKTSLLKLVSKAVAADSADSRRRNRVNVSERSEE
jgi:ribonuclease P protein component